MYLTKKLQRGDIAATLTILTMVMMTVGVLFGTSLVSRNTPQSQTEAAANSGNFTAINNSNVSLSGFSNTRARNSTTRQEITTVNLCFKSSPSSQGRYKLAIYTTNDSTFRTWDADNNIGQAIEKNVGNPGTITCGNGSVEMNMVYLKEPTRPGTGGGTGSGGSGGASEEPSESPSPSEEPSTSPSEEPSESPSPSEEPSESPSPSVSPPGGGGGGGGGGRRGIPIPSISPSPAQHFSGTFQGAVIVLETQNMGFTDVVVGKIGKNQFDEPGSGGSGGGSSSSPTPEVTLPPADKCWATCQTGISNDFGFGSNDTCGTGLTCTNITSLPVECTSETAQCRCIPDDKSTARTFEDACGDRLMCHERIVINGKLNITGDIPLDSNGNELRFRVRACSGTSAEDYTCSSSSPTTFVDPSTKEFSFFGLPQVRDKSYSIIIDNAVYSRTSEEEVKSLEEEGVEVLFETCTTTQPGVTAQGSNDNRVCNVEMTNAASQNDPACRIDNVNFKVDLPAATNTPSPTPRSEEDRTLDLQFGINNYTSVTLARPTRCRDGRCSVKCEPQGDGTCKIIFSDGLKIEKIKYQICSVMPSGDNSNCSDTVTLDDLDLGPVKEGNLNGNPLRKDAPAYVMAEYAEDVEFKNCIVEFDDDTEVDCRLNAPSEEDPLPEPSGTGNRRRTGSSDKKWYVGLKLYGQEDGGVYSLPLFQSQTEATDVSGNNCVNVDDYSRVILSYGKTIDEAAAEQPQEGEGISFDPTQLSGDVNFDGIVNAFDLAILLTSLGQGDNCIFNQPVESNGFNFFGLFDN